MNRHTTGQIRFQRDRWIARRKRLVKNTRIDDTGVPENYYNKQDPFDCGKPDCGVCARGVSDPTRRALRHALEEEEALEYTRSHERAHKVPEG